MSDLAKNRKLVEVTSATVLVYNGMRITWQGFRPAGAQDPNPTVYYTTLPADGSGSTEVDLVGIGVQSPTHREVTLQLVAGAATLDGKKLDPNDPPTTIPGANGGTGASLVYTSEACIIKVCPVDGGSTAPEASARDGDSEPGYDPPPPPWAGNNGND